MEGTNKTVHTRTQEKGAITSQETDPDLPMRVRDSLAEAWVGSGLLQDRTLSAGTVHTWDLLKDVIFVFITSTTVWPQIKQKGGEGHSTTLQYKIGLKIY